jgi:hypothetical protein
MREWLAQLEGEEEDLKALSEIFCSPKCNIGRDVDGYYYLRSSDFAPIADESARDARATELVRNTNVAARLLLGDNFFAVKFDGMARIEDDGRRYRRVGKSLHISYHVRTFYNDAAPEEAESLIGLLDDQEFGKVVSLFAHSLNTNDEFKRFLYGWKALEIFTDKVFRWYRQALISGKVGVPATSKYSKQLAEAKEIAKSKTPPLLARFGAIAAGLANETSNSDVEELDSDVDEFQHLKKLRDALFHTPDAAEASLPTVTVELQSLLSKYLRMHLQHADS